MALFGRDQKMERLRKVPIFKGCSRRQLLAIAQISEVMDVPAGKTLARAGEPGKEFSLILYGAARVEAPTGKRLRLRPGDFFGEMSLLDGGPRSATVVAETNLLLLLIDRREFWTLLSTAPKLGREMLVSLSQRVRQAERSMVMGRVRQRDEAAGQTQFQA